MTEHHRTYDGRRGARLPATLPYTISRDIPEESCSRTRPLSCCRPVRPCRRAAQVVGAVGVETPSPFRPLPSSSVDATAALSRRRPPTPRPPAATVATAAPGAPSPPVRCDYGGGTGHQPPPPPPAGALCSGAVPPCRRRPRRQAMDRAR